MLKYIKRIKIKICQFYKKTQPYIRLNLLPDFRYSIIDIKKLRLYLCP
jgi:hypothetical protein